MNKPEKNIHPILSLVFSVMLFATGLLFVKKPWFVIYLAAFLILLLLFRFERTMLRTIPFVLIFGALTAGLTAVNGTPSDILYAFYRVLALALAAVLSISIKPIRLVRAFNQLKVPRWISLGLLIVIRFMQIFYEEIQQIRQAIVLRGIRFSETPLLWARAFFIPLIVRVLSISEGLAISLETRAFSTELEGSSYETIDFKKKDRLFAALFLACLLPFIYLSLGDLK
ncbi:MAG: hypothetical protein GX975_04135 [Clostridiales bacterium]|nr:hypothetical protein [Clostridiales bacterium]